MNTPRYRKTRRNGRHGARGVAAIELAIVLMLMVTLFGGVIEVGRALYAYDNLVKTVRNGARYYNTAVIPDATTRRANTLCMVVYGQTSCSGTPVVPELTEAMVTVTDACNTLALRGVLTGQGPLDLVSVRISNFVFEPLMAPFFPSVTFDPISITMAQPVGGACAI